MMRAQIRDHRDRGRFELARHLRGDVALEPLGHLAQQIAQERPLGERVRERRGDAIGRRRARPELDRDVDLPGLPLAQQEPQVDLLAGLEVAQHVRLRETDAPRDVTERDLAHRALARELAGGQQDRLAPLLLVLGAPCALVRGNGRHRPSIARFGV